MIGTTTSYNSINSICSCSVPKVTFEVRFDEVTVVEVTRRAGSGVGEDGEANGVKEAKVMGAEVTETGLKCDEVTGLGSRRMTSRSPSFGVSLSRNVNPD